MEVIFHPMLRTLGLQMSTSTMVVPRVKLLLSKTASVAGPGTQPWGLAGPPTSWLGCSIFDGYQSEGHQQSKTVLADRQEQESDNLIPAYNC